MLHSITSKRAFFKILSIFLVGATLVGCQPALPTPTLKVPFSLGKGGESVEFDFRVKETYGYVVGLEFLFKDIKEFEDHQAAEALIEQLGASFSADGSIPFVRTPITLRMRVKSIEVEGPPVDFDYTTDQIGFTYASKEFASRTSVCRAFCKLNDLLRRTRQIIKEIFYVYYDCLRSRERHAH